jgi:ubiquinone/menaquinone biosynthesis C-methylase UbiE
MKNSDNSPNKSWWDNNPMTYVEAKEIVNWDDSRRFVQKRTQFEKLNQDYLDTNPYLKTFFNDDNIRHSFKGKHILDIGTGWGTSSLLLESCEGKVTAIDLSDTSIAGAKKNHELFGKGSVEIIKMDAEKLEFPNETFDYIYSWGVIHHSRSTETIVEEIDRVLKPGGQGLIMVYNRYSTRYYLIGLWYLLVKGKIFKGESFQSVQKYFTDGYWHRHFTPKEFDLILQERGLDVDKVEPTQMARRILPGIKEGSVMDEWLKKKFGWLLVATFSKPT